MKEVRDYSKEEIDRIRNEMQKFAKALDDRFDRYKPMIEGTQDKLRAGSIEQHLEIERVKDEVVRITENYKKDMSLHREDTDQVMMKLLKQIKEVQTVAIGGSGTGLGGGEIKQDTVVNILVRIELLEQEMRSLKNQFESSMQERNG